MSSICVLKIPNVKSRFQEQSHGRAAGPPINLLAFLQAENHGLQNMVAQFERDTKALREVLQGS